jgi:hypothetical protein
MSKCDRDVLFFATKTEILAKLFVISHRALSYSLKSSEKITSAENTLLGILAVEYNREDCKVPFWKV